MGIIKDLLDWLPDTFLSKYTHLYVAPIVFILSQSILYHIYKNSPKDISWPRIRKKDRRLCASLIAGLLWLRFSQYPSVSHIADMALTAYYILSFLIVSVATWVFLEEKAKKK